MSLSWESNDQSYLTDEILQEAIEFDEQLEKSRQFEQSRDFISTEIRHEHDAEDESEHDDYFNAIAHRPLVNAATPDGDEESSRYLLPSIDESSIPTTSSQEREQLNQKLSWRLDPSQSLSDWELHIFNRSSKTFEVYHVHRVVLALGPRGCEFFQDVFRQSEGASEPSSSKKTTRVPLIAESCKLIGCFLDYVYNNEHFQITNENALGLCYLADYFRNHSLWELATDFIEDDLGKASGREHLCQYYTDSIYYDQDEFLDHILSVCSRDLLSIMEDGIPCSKLFGELTPSHFMRILVDMEPPTEEQLSSALLLTRAINEFCCMHRHELSMETFDNFTSRIILLDASSAMTLMEASLEYDFGSLNDSDQEENRASKDSIESLILFQQQCIETLAEEWEETLELDQSRLTRIMRILALRKEHQSILVDWFQKTVKRASNHLVAARQETEKGKQQSLRLEDRCKELNEKVEIAEEETALAERNHNTTKSEMKTQISSWMRKNEGTNQLRQAEQQQWEHERLRWQMEVQQLQHEKSKLKQELKHLRRQTVSLTLQQQHHSQQHHSEDHSKYSSSHRRDRYRGQTMSSGHSRKPIVIPDDSLLSDSESSVSESDWDNSMLEPSRGSSRRESHGYPINNEMSPQFRIL